MKTKTLTIKKAALATTALLMSALVTGQAQAEAMKADFNGDGYEDMVVGMPDEDIGTRNNAGAVKVIYGRADGTIRPHSKTHYLHQTRHGEPGIHLYDVAQAGDKFGASVAVGDFNQDGYDDLAMSAPGQKIYQNGIRYNSVGLVNVAYGSRTGLTSNGNHPLHMTQLINISGYEQFGSAMSVGDYDGDGVDDLAVSFLSRVVNERRIRGGVVLYFGQQNKGLESPDGFTPNRRMLIEPDNTGLTYSAFGYRLASGDFNNDGRDDLAVTKYYGEYRGIASGTVHVAFGMHDWSRAPRGGYFRKTIAPLGTRAVHGGHFGEALAAGDFNRDGRDELAVGMMRSEVSGKKSSGAVFVYTLNTLGHTGKLYYQSQPNIPGSSKKGDFFGQSLAVADFDQDGYEDLAIGVSGKDKVRFFGDYANVGEVVVMEGSFTGLSKAQVWHQDKTGVAGTRKTWEQFGKSLSTGDFNNDGYPDLLVGIPGEDHGSKKDAGSVQLILGDRSLVTTYAPPREQHYNQGSFTSAGFGSSENEFSDRFGSVLAP